MQNFNLNLTWEEEAGVPAPSADYDNRHLDGHTFWVASTDLELSAGVVNAHLAVWYHGEGYEWSVEINDATDPDQYMAMPVKELASVIGEDTLVEAQVAAIGALIRWAAETLEQKPEPSPFQSIATLIYDETDGTLTWLR